jgi:hypothetical protein
MFKQCEIFFGELGNDPDPQCARFKRWLGALLRDKSVNKTRTAMLYRRVSYYKLRKQNPNAVVKSRHLGRALHDGDLTVMERGLQLARADNYLLQRRASYLEDLIRAYLYFRQRVGRYPIYSYQLPEDAYRQYVVLLNQV